MDTTAGYTGEKLWFSSDEAKWARELHRLKEEHPEEVQIIREPEDNDGCIYAAVPSSWLKLVPKRKLNFSEEHRQELRERMAQLAQNRSKHEESRQD